MTTKPKTNFFLDNDDIQFQLKNRLDYKLLFDLMPVSEKETAGFLDAEDFWNTWLGTMEAMGEACGAVFSINAEKVEKEDLYLDANREVVFGPTVLENKEMIKQLGIPSLGIDPSYGGIGGPFCMEVLGGELISRACPSTYLNAVWYGPIAAVIEHFGSQEQKEKYLPLIASGELSGSMALTEADTGSDLGAMKSFGEWDEKEKSWRIWGSKRFISNACGGISLVLAQSSKNSRGLGTLNLFLVERILEGKQNYTITKIEEKIGLHGSATCEIQFEGSRAELIGEVGKGFRYMSLLMNTARIAVGYQGLGMQEAIFRLAQSYARERKSWGKYLWQHELVAEKLLDMEVEIKALRSLSYQAAYSATVVAWIEKKLKNTSNEKISDDKKFELKKLHARHQKRLRSWTPLIKWWAGEKTPAHARTGMQILGGYGFTKEYKAEWWLRESMIISIYEGTSQMQALMSTKDTLKEVIRHPAAFIETTLSQKWVGFTAMNPMRKKLIKLKRSWTSAVLNIIFKLMRANVSQSFSEVKVSDIRAIVRILAKDIVKFENISPALLHAERLCEMKALVAMATSLVKDAEAHESRSWIAERFLFKAQSRMEQLKFEIEQDDGLVFQFIDKKLGKKDTKLKTKKNVTGLSKILSSRVSGRKNKPSFQEASNSADSLNF